MVALGKLQISDLWPKSVVGTLLLMGVAILGVSYFSTWMIQQVVLGALFPEWGTDVGLLEGHDGVKFHELAVAKALEIEADGWQAWELRPETQTVSGIMSAWYVLTEPHPLSWGIVQSLMYGLGGLALFAVLWQVSGNLRAAVMASLVVLFLPSAAIIYSLPHHDVFVFAGFMFFVWGWCLVFLMLSPSTRRRLASGVLGAALILTGFVLLTLFRSFLQNIFWLATFVLCALFIAAVASHSIRRKTVSLFVYALVPLVVFSALTALLVENKMRPLNEGVGVNEKGIVEVRGISIALSPDKMEKRSDRQGKAHIDSPAAEYTGLLEVEGRDANLAAESGAQVSWQRTPRVPAALDLRLEQLAIARDRVIILDGHGRTALDTDVRFNSATDVLRYLPRALQIGYLAPFPHHWRPDEMAPQNRNVDRAIIGIEMMFVYIVLIPAALLAIWQWRREPAMWVCLIVSGIYIVVYALAFPVVGSLVRYRFPAYALLTGLAFAKLLDEILKRRRPRIGSGSSV